MNCKICNSENLNDIIANNKKYYNCNDCGFIFIDERYLATKEEELAEYELHENTIENKGYVQMFENFMKEGFYPYAKSCKRVLDFGCGPGPVLSELIRRNGYEVEVYDIFYSPDIPEGLFDFVTSTEVFEHFINPLKEIEFILSLMKKGAYLSIMTQYHPNDSKKFEDWWYNREVTHISFYTEKTFEYIASKYDLDYVYNNKKNISVFMKR
jgi:SAM-dependent methyltransferase